MPAKKQSRKTATGSKEPKHVRLSIHDEVTKSRSVESLILTIRGQKVRRQSRPERKSASTSRTAPPPTALAAKSPHEVVSHEDTKSTKEQVDKLPPAARPNSILDQSRTTRHPN